MYDHHQTGVVTHPTAQKSLYTTPNPFELQFGYHRAIRKGPFIFVSGTTALIETTTSTSTSSSQEQERANPTEGDSKVHHPTDARKQAQVAMSRCLDAVEKLGGKKGDVVRVKMFVSRHEDCLAVGEAFKDCFAERSTSVGEIGAAATMVVIKDGFVDPDVLVEVEVDAVVDS